MRPKLQPQYAANICSSRALYRHPVQEHKQAHISIYTYIYVKLKVVYPAQHFDI